MKHKAISQLLCASLVDKQFQKDMLRNPSKAIADGYLNHIFHISEHDQKFITNIKANTIEVFADQIHTYLLEKQSLSLEVSNNTQRDDEELTLPRWQSFNQFALADRSIKQYLIEAAY